MEFCHKVGIQYSEFLSWPESDQEAEISYMVYEKSRCPSCGTFPEDWLDEEGKHKEPQPFMATTVACLGCEMLAETRNQIPEEKRGTVHVYLQPALPVAKEPRRGARHDKPAGTSRNQDHPRR